MRRAITIVLTGLLAFISPAAALSPAKGTIAFKSQARDLTADIKFAYLVKGPDEIDPKLAIRRLILTSRDLDKALRACQSFACTTDALTEGISIDLDPGPQMNYWLVLGSDGAAQHADTEPMTSLTATTNAPSRIAGRIAFDATRTGGPKVSAEFDAPLIKTFTKAR